MSKLRLEYIKASDFATLEHIDPHTIYWLDNGLIYVNGHRYGGGGTGSTVLYNLLRDEEGNIELLGTDESVSKVNVAPLRIGDHVYNGTEEVVVEVYKGEMNDDEAKIVALINQLTQPKMTITDTTSQRTMTMTQPQQTMQLMNNNNMLYKME